MKNIVPIIILLIIFSCKADVKEKRYEMLEKDTTKVIVKKDRKNNFLLKNEVISFLMMFYKEYTSELKKKIVDFKVIDNIKKKYCTLKLINKLAQSELDYDPFLNAQDVNDDILKSIIINDTDEEGVYIVSYDGYNDDKIYVKLLLIKIEGDYKVSDIIE